MKTLAYLWRAWSLIYYRAALASLTQRNPTHPDIPYIVLQISALEDQQRSSHLHLP